MNDFGVRDKSCPTQIALHAFVTAGVTGVRNRIWSDPSATAGLCLEVSAFPNEGYLTQSEKTTPKVLI